MHYIVIKYQKLNNDLDEPIGIMSNLSANNKSNNIDNTGKNNKIKPPIQRAIIFQ